MEDKGVHRKPAVAPLSDSFFLISIIGFYISLIFVMPRSADFGVAFAIVFGTMFIAAMVSLTYAPARALISLEEYERKRKKGKLISHSEYLKEHKSDNKRRKKR